MSDDAEARRQILRMLEEGKIDADDAARLMAAVGRDAPRQTGPAAAGPRRVRVRVTDAATGREKVDVVVPVVLVQVLTRLLDRFAPRGIPEIDDVTDAVRSAVASGTPGRVVAFHDPEGDHVEIAVE